MKKRSSAFTLIELIISVVLIGIVLLSLFIGIQEALKTMRAQKDESRAIMLCEDLMLEIRSKEYSGRYGGVVTARSDCIGIDDYNGWTGSPPETMEGFPIPGSSGFVRRVSVEFVDTNSFVFNGPAVTNYTGFKRVTVVVSNALAAVSNVSVIGAY